jgi:hypothetical protein
LGQDGFAGWIEIPTRLRLSQRRNFREKVIFSRKKPEHAAMRRELQEEEKNFQLSAERIRGILSKLAIAHAKHESRLEGKDRRGNENQPVYILRKGERVVEVHTHFLLETIVLVPTSHFA